MYILFMCILLCVCRLVEWEGKKNWSAQWLDCVGVIVCLKIKTFFYLTKMKSPVFRRKITFENYFLRRYMMIYILDLNYIKYANRSDL